MMTPTMGNDLARLVVFLLMVAAFTIAGLNGWRLYRMLRLGGPENRFDRPAERRGFFVENVLLQKRVMNKRVIGLLHFIIFVAFLVIQVGLIEMFVAGLFPGVEVPIISSAAFAAVLDLFLLLAGLACLGAAWRRWVVRPPFLHNSRDAALILILIGGVVVTFLFTHAYFILANDPHDAKAMFVSYALAQALRPFTSPEAAQALFAGWWWAHILVVLGFLAYIPTSKHLHLFAAPLTGYFVDLKPKGALAPIENIEEAEHFGVGKLEDLSWRQLLDTYACTECGRCDENCPALLSDKPLSPKMLILDIKEHLFETAPLKLTGVAGQVARFGFGERQTDHEKPDAVNQVFVGGVIQDETLWSCTTCRHCVTACPVFIEHVPKIVDMRRYLVLEENRFPHELQNIFESMERNQNPLQVSNFSRADWAARLNVKFMADHPEAEVLYWVGCVSSFDQRNQKVAESIVRILQAANVDFAILGLEESCTGDPARRIGNEYLYQIMAQMNVETLNRYQPKMILTGCAHCFNTIANEYPQFGGRYNVVHHSVFIRRLIAEGRLKLDPTVQGLLDGTGDGRAGPARITFHDPCYIGRYNDIYDQPREVLAAVPGIEQREMARTRERSFCCGAGGGRAFMEERTGKRINRLRVQQAVETGAEVIATACPFCTQMFEDGINGEGVRDRIRVLDIAEIVGAHLAEPAQTDAPAAADD